MKDEIRVGDLVIVVHSCCGHALGTPFRVGAIVNNRFVRCEGCNVIHYLPFASNEALIDGRLCNWPIAFLKKIDPPALTESTPTSEKVEA